jgi:hypothetical protein
MQLLTSSQGLPDNQPAPNAARSATAEEVAQPEDLPAQEPRQVPEDAPAHLAVAGQEDCGGG